MNTEDAAKLAASIKYNFTIEKNLIYFSTDFEGSIVRAYD